MMPHREDATITVMRYRYWHPQSDSLVESEAFLALLEAEEPRAAAA